MGLFPEPQTTLDFPQPLSEKYRPRTIAEFIGLEKQKKILGGFVRAPKSGAWLFHGPSGVGKSTMALALCDAIEGELHHIPSQKANIQTLEEVVRMCWYVPRAGTFHVVLVDELDVCTNAFQLALLSKLDSTARIPNTIWIFTSNGSADELQAKLEKRFLSRCWMLEFSSYGMRSEIAALLADVWQKETGTQGNLNWDRIAKDSGTNVRAALSALEMELLAA
jgi:replication-associated recombination protein RarA